MVPVRPATSSDTSAAKRAGFTLMELMIVVVIVAIMAMTVAPSLSEALIGNRHSNAAMHLVRFGRQIRSQAIATNTAQLMHYVKADTGGLGRIQRYVGMTNKCLQSRWDLAMGDADKGAKAAWAFDMLEFNPGGSTDDTKHQVIGLYAIAQALPELADGSPDLSSPKDEAFICYQPDGMAYATFVDEASLEVMADGVEFVFRRTLNATKHGVDRVVLFPASGNARLK